MNNEISEKEKSEKETKIDNASSNCPNKSDGVKYCVQCEKEIPTGKEIKVADYLHHSSYYQWNSYYCSRSPWFNSNIWDGRSFPTSQSIYYLCPPCYRWYQNIWKRKRGREMRNMVMLILLPFILTLIIVLIVSITMLAVRVGR